MCKKIFLIILLINQYNQLSAQNYKNAFTIQSGITLGMADRTYMVGTLENKKHLIGISYTGNIKYNIRLVENLHLVLGGGIVKQIIKDEATLAIDSSGQTGGMPNYENQYTKEIKSRMLKFDIGLEFTFYNSERFKFNTLLSYTPGIVLNWGLSYSGQKTINPNIIKGYRQGIAGLYSDGIKFGLNGEYKLGEKKRSSVLMEASLNQGLRVNFYIYNYVEASDTFKSSSALLSNKGSYFSIQIGYRVYFSKLKKP